MAKRATGAIGCAIGCIGWLLLAGCSPACFLKPKTSFDAEELAEPPDYGTDEAWAVLPERDSKADFTPPSVARGDEPPADVFFVYPTVWIDREVWNDPLDSAKSREMLDELILPGQASVFNGCCRIFAPLYRQATLGAYYGEIDEAARAFSVAYDDVERAFEAFLDRHNDDRPFIIAAHSQGSMHAMRLLERVDSDAQLRRRMVAAYIPGAAHPMPRFETHYHHLEPCETPQQTGCIAAWDTYREDASADGADPLKYWTGEQLAPVADDTPRQCTNPVSWRADERPSDTADHLGAVPRINEGESASFWRMMRSSDAVGLDVTGLEEPRPEMLTARCEDGVLRVPDLSDVDYEAAETTPGNYHLLDYELFHMDIRHNAIERTRTWIENHGQPAPGAGDDESG